MATRKSNGRVAPAASTPRLVLSQAEQVVTTAGTIARISDEVSEGAESQTRVARSRAHRHQRDVGVAQGDRRAGRLGHRLRRGAGVRRSTRWPPRSSRSPPTPPASRRRSPKPARRSRRRAASIQHVAGSTQEMATAAQQVTASITEMASSVKSISRDTEALTSSVNETAAAIEEMTAVDQGGVGERRRPRGRGGGNLVVDQRDGRVDRGGRRDDRAASPAPSSRTRPRSSRWRARCRAWRRADRGSPRWRATPRPPRREMERSIQSVSAHRAPGRRADPARHPRRRRGRRERAALDPGDHPDARLDGAVGRRDARDGQAHRRHQPRSSTPST